VKGINVPCLNVPASQNPQNMQVTQPNPFGNHGSNTIGERLMQPIVQDAEFVDQAIDFQDEDAQRRWTETLTRDPSRNLPPGKSVPAVTSDEFGRATV
jgi:hypothetical protein